MATQYQVFSYDQDSITSVLMNGVDAKQFLDQQHQESVSAIATFFIEHIGVGYKNEYSGQPHRPFLIFNGFVESVDLQEPITCQVVNEEGQEETATITTCLFSQDMQKENSYQPMTFFYEFDDEALSVLAKNGFFSNHYKMPVALESQLIEIPVKMNVDVYSLKQGGVFICTDIHRDIVPEYTFEDLGYDFENYFVYEKQAQSELGQSILKQFSMMEPEQEQVQDVLEEENEVVLEQQEETQIEKEAKDIRNSYLKEEKESEVTDEKEDEDSVSFVDKNEIVYEDGELKVNDTTIAEQEQAKRQQEEKEAQEQEEMQQLLEKEVAHLKQTLFGNDTDSDEQLETSDPLISQDDGVSFDELLSGDSELVAQQEKIDSYVAKKIRQQKEIKAKQELALDDKLREANARKEKEQQNSGMEG